MHNSKFVVGSFGKNSVLLTEGSILTDVGVTSLKLWPRWGGGGGGRQMVVCSIRQKHIWSVIPCSRRIVWRLRVMQTLTELTF
jgi:hypothetical protein